MRNTGYNKLQLVLIAVKDWRNFLKLGEIPPKASRKKHYWDVTNSFNVVELGLENYSLRFWLWRTGNAISFSEWICNWSNIRQIFSHWLQIAVSDWKFTQNTVSFLLLYREMISWSRTWSSKHSRSTRAISLIILEMSAWCGRKQWADEDCKFVCRSAQFWHIMMQSRYSFCDWDFYVYCI